MILITGANGQLGRELSELLKEKNINYIATDSTILDITNRELVVNYINELQPKVIYHCAAYTAVDKAEDEGKQQNILVNVGGTENIAYVAEKVGAKLVYISTDYVFDGNKIDGEYNENDKVNPLNEYGQAKLLGEEKVRELMKEFYIIRTSWVFGKYGNNFVYTMQRLAKDRDKLTIVDDQIGRPTWTRTLAEFMLYAVENNIEYGTYHLSNDASCSWYEFAKEILKDSDVQVIPILSSEFPQKATRPKYSIMNLEKAKNTGFIIPTWKQALGQFLKESE